MNDNSFVKRLSQYPRPIALLLCVVLQIIVFLTSEIRYETNDDLYMNIISSGFLGGRPDAHLPYTHFLIGKIISQLYLWSTSYNWYALYLISVQFISWLLIFYVLSGRKQPFIHIGFALGLYVFLGPIFFSHLQFTTTSTLATVSGMMLFYHSINGATINRKKLVASLLVLIVGLMIRKESGALVIILCSLPFLRTDSIKANFKPVAIIASVGILWAGIQYSNKYYFEKDAGWSRYYNELLSGNRFNDNPAFFYFMGTKDMKEINGWNNNDLALFASFFRSYEPVYNLENYQKMYDSYNQLRPLPFRDYLYKLRTLFFPPFIVIFILFSLYYHRNRERLLIIVQSLLLAALAWYIYATLQMKERAILSMVLAYFSGVILVNDKLVIPPIRRNQIISSIAIFALIVGGFILQRKVRNQLAQSTLKDREITRNLLSFMSKSDVTWLVWGSTLPLESLSPFEHNLTYKDNRPKIFPVVSTHKNPLLIERYGSSLHSILPDSNSRILTLDLPFISFVPERLDTFYREHLNCELQLAGDSIEHTTGRRIFWFKGCQELQSR